MRCAIAIITVVGGLVLALPCAFAQEPSKPGAGKPEAGKPEAPKRPSLLVREVLVAGHEGPVSILVQDGRITAIARGLRAPGVAVLDGAGRRVVPGRIDAWARLDGADPLGRAVDAFDRWDRDAIEAALAQGVTTVYAAPGGKGLLLGLGSVLKLRPLAASSDALVVVRESAVAASLGGPLAPPLQRMGQLGDLRARLERARRMQEARAEYQESVERWLASNPSPIDSGTPTSRPATDAPRPDAPSGGGGGGPRGRRRRGGNDVDEAGDGLAVETPAKPASEGGKPPERPRPPQPDRGSALLARVLDRELPLRLEAHRAEDILGALELGHELGLRLVIEGATEADRVADALRARRASVVLGPPVLGVRGDYGAPRFEPGAAAALERARVPLAIGSGDWDATPSLDLAAALAAGAGLPRAVAEEAITTRAAEVLGLGDRLGRVAPGFEGDLVLLGAQDPLGAAAPVEVVVIEGEVVWRRAR